MKAIETKALSGGYPARIVLKALDVSIEMGHFTAIAGPNGSGKSTFLRHLIRELRGVDGSISVLGVDIDGYSPIQLARKVAFTGQANQLDVDFTVEEYVALGRYPSGDTGNIEKVQDALCRTGIEELGKRPITTLSGGEKQLAAIARAICQESDILLLDEPVSSLDPKHQKRVMEILTSLVQDGKSVVAVLHDLDAVFCYADDCILMKDGKVFSQGTVNEVLSEENLEAVYEIECTIETVKERRVVLF